jgi:hypothetical protein
MVLNLVLAVANGQEGTAFRPEWIYEAAIKEFPRLEDMTKIMNDDEFPDKNLANGYNRILVHRDLIFSYWPLIGLGLNQKLENFLQQFYYRKMYNQQGNEWNKKWNGQSNDIAKGYWKRTHLLY